MTKANKCKNSLRIRKGYLLSKEVAELRIPKTFLAEFVSKYGLDRVLI